MRPKWTASSQVAAGKVIAQKAPPQMSGGQYICSARNGMRQPFMRTD